MTMPHLMNCPHSHEGWCINCVKELWEEYNQYPKFGSPFKTHTGMFGSTEPGQIVTKENINFLPPGSVVRFEDSDDVLIHLHDNLWYRRSGCSWCYDNVERFYRDLPGILCHHP